MTYEKVETYPSIRLRNGDVVEPLASFRVVDHLVRKDRVRHLIRVSLDGVDGIELVVSTGSGRWAPWRESIREPVWPAAIINEMIRLDEPPPLTEEDDAEALERLTDVEFATPLGSSEEPPAEVEEVEEEADESDLGADVPSSDGVDEDEIDVEAADAAGIERFERRIDAGLEDDDEPMPSGTDGDEDGA